MAQIQSGQIVSGEVSLFAACIVKPEDMFGTDHIGILNHGHLLFEGTPEELKEKAAFEGYPDDNLEDMFLALIDNAEELSEGDAELYLSDSVTDYSSIISLENYFVRTENDGRAYVYIQGEDGKLKKQYVELGQEYYGIATEIRSGLEESDLIAFPYGDDVAEGADTVEVDSLMN